MTAPTFAARVTVRLAPGVNDPQGSTVRDGLRSLGFEAVREVRVGKVIDLVVEADDAAAAEAAVQAMCEALLANPVIERYEVAVAAEAGH